MTSSTYPGPHNLRERLDDLTGERPTEALTPADARRLRMVLGSMPYLPLAGALAVTEQTTIKDVAELLAELAAVLARHGDEHRELEARHDRLTRDLEAVRRVFGTAVQA